MSDRSINDLCPNLRIIAREVFAQANALGKPQGWTCAPIVTYRSPVDQNTAKAKGLSNAGAGESPHNICDENGPSSWAFDFGIFEANGHYIQDGTDPRYHEVAMIAKSLGLESGRDWHHPDYDHLEMPGWETVLAKQST